MVIKIAERLRPFSHQSGTYCLLPRSGVLLHIFPTAICMEGHEIPLEIRGPVREFTVQQDLEKGRICVHGKAENGYFRIFISQEKNGILLRFDKFPVYKESILIPKGNLTSVDGDEPIAKLEDSEKSMILRSLSESRHPSGCRLNDASGNILEEVGKRASSESGSKGQFFASSSFAIGSNERLSLGMHKKQEWEMIKRRSDLKEIFPLWLKLAQGLPDASIPSVVQGTHALLHCCEEQIAKKDKLNLARTFLNFFHGAFTGMLVPRLHDAERQGLVEDVQPSHDLPLFLLKKGAQLIRSLFFQEQEKNIFSLLSCLPPEFHAGRYLQLKSQEGTLIDIEWSKKLLRRVVIHPPKLMPSDTEIQLKLPQSIKSFRLRHALHERGQILPASRPFLLSSPIIYLDRFQK